MASRAINARSFCNYVVSLCKYYDGTSLTSAHRTQLYDYLIEGYPPANVLSINKALAILNKLYSQMMGEYKEITIANGSLGSALSYNTAIELVDIVLTTGNRAQFCTLDQFYGTDGNFKEFDFMAFKFFLPANDSFAKVLLTGTLVGGGGGGSGGVGGDGGKGSSFTLQSDKGADGARSYIQVWNPEEMVTEYFQEYEIAGGAGGGITACTISGDVSHASNGNSGSSGDKSQLIIDIYPKGYIYIRPGCGGGGGGACSARYGSANMTFEPSYLSVTSPLSTRGGDGACCENNWSNEDYSFAGGGGEGGQGYNAAITGVGANSSLGTGAPTTYSATHQSRGVGGTGGHTSNTPQSDQPNIIGAGGLGGAASFSNNVWDCSNGGNGGNAGGFILDTIGSAATTLFIWRQN